MYENFDMFKKYWIEDDGKSFLPFNIPLLYDFPSELQFKEALQDEAMGLSFQRLIVTVAQPRKRRIKTLFIKNVSDADFESIQDTVLSSVNSSLNEMF